MKLRSAYRRSPLLAILLLAACATPPGKPPGESHLAKADAPAPDPGIPSPVKQNLAVPKPKAGAKTETYSVVVNNVKVQDLLFALARDAKINVDVHNDLQGTVTLNAIDQTLPQILNRLSKQVDLRWELDGQNLAVMRDTPFLHNYKVDYVNMKRDTTGSINVSGEIAGAGIGAGGSSGSNNVSTTKIDNTTKNHFWETLVQNIKDLLHETDKVFPEGSSDTQIERSTTDQPAGGALLAQNAGLANQVAGKSGTALQIAAQLGNATTTVKRATFREAASVIANPETGIISVRATSRQQEKVQQFLDQVLSSAKRQVMIEATIAEVELSNQYQQGIDWSRVSPTATAKGIFTTLAGAAVTGSTLQTAAGGPAGVLTINARGSAGNNGTFTSAITLLETFGNVKVLSSPKISVVNNQSAILKVVDNQVYFNVKADTVANQTNTTTNFTTEQRVVPVGFIMNVTPQISDQDEILLNVRPSITRILRYEEDPNPSLSTTNPVTGEVSRISNKVPVIRTREMESVLRVQDGAIAVMGGLMEESIRDDTANVPWFHTIPFFGALFVQKSQEARKTELVIFLRPKVIREASVGADFSRVREHLPGKEFFGNNPGPKYQLLPAYNGPGSEPK